ncbi:MAG: hypothetical protein A2Z88_04015 [Omnitrophica WOR_2 bacterium GWA2_47_8]|nr:MAG: hypothetical protein A2Z88_04015 [Omnitrophica WOR_2 bacterium GWA2_47_8]
MLSLIILIAGVLLSSALMSMMEAAILSLPLIRARVLLEENRRNSRLLFEIKTHIHMTVAVIVIINNAINICGSIFIGERVTKIFGDQWLGLSAGVMTFTIIIIGEIIPKIIGERYKVRLSLFFAPLLTALVVVFGPIAKLILYLEKPLTRHFKMPSPRVTEEEIKLMLQFGRDAGTVEMDEEVLCSRVFKLNDLKAYQIMRAIDEAYALPADKTLQEVKDSIIDSRFSRIVVYGKEPVDIIGVAQQSVLLREMAKDNYNAKVQEFMAKPVYVNWFTKADELLEKFQVYNQHLFIVQDSGGKNVGIVTMEDVLEELFGEIYDEKDIKPKILTDQQLS